MAKSKKSKTDFSAYVPVARTLLRVGIVGAVIGGGAYGYHRLCNQVESRLAMPARPPQIVLKNQPVWMNDELAEQIVRSVAPKTARSATDHGLLREIGDQLAANPWVKTVKQVRRSFVESVGDTVEISCEYRAPLALVNWGKEYQLVDGEGFRLPIRFAIGKGADGKPALPQIMFSEGHTNLRIIEGVGAPAPKDGQLWQGEDLQAGLDLVKLLYGKAFAEDIYRIDVSNFRRRLPEKAAEIALLTKYGTEIRWGEPVRIAFHAEVPPTQKLERLSKIIQQYGRVDANHSWIDIRLDKVTYPVEEKLVQGN